ncbi:hypothetical protein ECE50_012950 [Chitinophaga sp. Mgbs1]|uniref:Uncharacterized protein n=1 Tax=Chitinophaga solisilvae TaxID=1233460 RepID=A0A3S1B2P8_9BACT|nr:hypothetical protein [Chitinophaga solisilvae]
MPLQLHIENEKAFVTANYSGSRELAPGTEITAINGKSMAAIIALLLPAIPSDGHNLTLKYRALDTQFPSWYRSMIAVTDSFTVSTGTQQTVTIPGAAFQTLARDGFLQEPSYRKTLDFRMTAQTGILTIHSFAATDIKKSGQHFRKFIDSVFLQLQQQKVQQLIVDLRDNTGGTDNNAVYFTRHFFDKPFRYWDRIEVTKDIARQIKGFARLFYRKPEKRDSSYLWKKSKITSEFNYYTMQFPAAHPFTGKTYVLINGFCMSSCADAAAILSCNKKAVLIGEETGGGYQGNNSGMMPSVRLKPTGLMLTVPLQQYFNAVDTGVHTARGVMPDYPVAVHTADILRQEDAAMTKAWQLIRQQPQE